MPPSVAVYVAASNRTVTAVRAGPSSSASLTVVLAVLPALTPVGSVPNAIVIDSPSSSSLSSSAVTVNVAEVSPALMVTDVSDSV